MREAGNFGGQMLPLRRPRRGWRPAGAQAMRPLTNMALDWMFKAPGRPYPSCGLAVWMERGKGDEALEMLAEVTSLALASSRLAGLLMHRALRPLLNLGKRLSATRGPVALGQRSALITLTTLCFFARALPEVLDPPELPHMLPAASLHASMLC